MNGPPDGLATPLRVVRVLTRPNLGGPTRQLIALWHAHRALGVRTLLVTGRVDAAAEAMLSPADGGVPALSWAAALAAGPAAEGWLELPTLQRGIAPWADLRAGAQLRRLLAVVKPQVVHTHTSKAGWLGRAAAWRVGVPVVAHTFHGHVLQDYFGRFGSAYLRRLEARLAARSHRLFAVSASCADELAASGVAARGRFVVVPPAVAVGPTASRAEARARFAIGHGERRAVCVGRLVPVKRVEDFVAMVAAGEAAGWVGDVFGDGPRRAALAALAGQVAPGRLHWHGAVPDLARWLAAFDVLVLPSVREGLPLVAVEAFAAGVPVVGYDVPGVRDALANLGRGILVPVGDGPRGLLAAAERCLADPAGTAAAAAGNRAAVAQFDPGTIARRLLAEYRAALAAADSGYHAVVGG